jgi:two-component system sensor histidine kinase AlgZ
VAPSHSTTETDFFLPNFCGPRSVFATVVLVELFAMVLALTAASEGANFWDVLALYSLFMQWCGLLSASLLCLLRRHLARLSDTAAGIVSYVLLLLVIGLLSLFADTLVNQAGFASIIGSRSEFLLRNLGIGAIVCALILRYFYVSHQWRLQIRAEARAKLEALQARIRPHFLFNSINTVSSLIHDKPDAAEEALLDLADLFRASLREGQRLIPLAEELALSRSYLDMESRRLGERLQLHWQLEKEAEKLLLPPLILQPLVENAVYHGIEPRPGGGTITINTRLEGQELVIAVSNPLPDASQQRSEGNRIALENIRARLDAHYGKQAKLSIEGGEGEYHVQIRLPARERE